MTSLVLVHVSSNKLETLPDSVVECPSLEALYANGNEISGLPTGIGTRLTNLKRLNLSNNKIHVLPLDLTERFGEPDPTSGLCDKVSPKRSNDFFSPCRCSLFELEGFELRRLCLAESNRR